MNHHAPLVVVAVLLLSAISARGSEPVTPPSPQRTVAPVYPAGLAGEASLLLAVTIDVDGVPRDIEVERSAGAAFDQAATTALAQWRFAPATQSGAPIAVRTSVPVRFSPPAPLEPEEPGEADEWLDAPVAGAAPVEETVLRTVVEDRGPARTASSHSIGRQALEDTNAKSAQDLLRRVPGVQVVQHGAEGKAPQLYLRGFDAVHGSDIEMRAAGVPLNEPNHVHGHGYLDLGFLIPELTKGLDVKKGAFELSQGPFATAGSVEYQLAAPRSGITLKTELGAPERARAVAIAAMDAERFVAVEAMTSAGFGVGRAAQRLSLNAGWSTDIGALTLRAGAFGYAGAFELPGAVREDDVDAGRVGLLDSYEVGAGQSLRALTFAGATLELDALEIDAQVFVGGKQVRIAENYTGRLADDEQGDRQEQRQTHLDLGATTQARWRLSQDLTLRGLGEARHVLGAQRVDAVGVTVRKDGEALALSSTSAAAGAGLDWRVLEGVQVGLSTRADAFLVSGAWSGALAPRATASWRPGLEGLRLFGAAGRGVRSPQAAGTEAGVVDSAEIGAQWNHELVEVAAAAFGVWSAGEVLFDHVARTTAVTDASQRLGAEARVTTYITDGLEIGGDLTVVDARLEGGELIPGVPSVAGSARVAWVPLEGLRVGAQGVAVGARPLRFGGSLEPTMVLNAFASYRWRFVELEAELDNVLDAAYAEGAGRFASRWGATSSYLPVTHLYAGAPRLLRVSLTLNF